MLYGWIFSFALLCSWVPDAIAATRFSGSIKSSTDIYQQDLGEPTDRIAPYLIGELGAKHKFNRKVRFEWRVFYLTNPESEDSGANLKFPANELNYLDLPEGFFEIKAGASKFRLGMNTINWGIVDGYSPSSVVNTSAFFHPLRTYKRGAPMVEWQVGGDALGFHALYIPRQPPAVFPAPDSRWLPRDALVNLIAGRSQVLLPDVLEYKFGSEIELNGAGVKARDNNYGLRLYSHLGSWDLQLTYFEGASSAPSVRPVLVINSDPVTNAWVAQSPVQLNPVSYRVRNSGLGIVHAGESWIFRFESAYQETLSQGFSLQPWSWISVGGLETNFDVGTNAITMIAQYYHTENPKKADNLISSSYRLFDRTGVLGLRWPMDDKWTFNATALYETEAHGLFWTAGLENKLVDALKWGLTWRDFSAPRDGLIKTFDKNDHVGLDVTYFF